MGKGLKALATLGAGAIAGLASSGISIAGQSGLQEDAQEFNHAEAELSREFTSRENSIARQFALDYDATKYQRQVNDMRAAGLNPALILGTTSTTIPLSGSSVAGQGANSPVGTFYASGFSQIVSSAINAGLTDSLRDDNFRKTMLSNTGKQLENLAEQEPQLTDHQKALLQNFYNSMR